MTSIIECAGLHQLPDTDQALSSDIAMMPPTRYSANSSVVPPARSYKAPPVRHWRSYGNDKLPTGAEALEEPFAAFPSWFLRITCDRCGKLQMINEVHAGDWRDRTLRQILGRMRHVTAAAVWRDGSSC